MRRRPPPTTPPKIRDGALVLLAALTSFGCFSAADGSDPPADRIYFPTGLALVNADRPEGASHLLVANSDYDLQYNAGTLQSLNLDRARGWIPKPCEVDADCASGVCDDDAGNPANGGVPSYWCLASEGAPPCGELEERPLREQLLHPGRCREAELANPPRDPANDAPFLTTSVRIGAFATDAIFRAAPVTAERAGRLFVPVRGDATLHWADILADGSIECGQDRNGGACDDLHRAGDDPDQENERELRLSPEPFAIDASFDGEAVLVSHQTTGRISLFVNDWEPGIGAGGPRLQDTLAQDLPQRPVGIAALPIPELVQRGFDFDPAVRVASAYAPGFLVTFRNVSPPQVHVVRYFKDAPVDDDSSGGALVRPFLARTGIAGIGVNSSGVDSRGIAVDARARTTAEQACARLMADAPAFAECLRTAAATPLDVYLANRSPASLVIGRSVSTVNEIQSTELPRFETSEALAQGPSRVVVGQIVTGTALEPVLETRVFVVCFESRRIFVYDPLRRRFEIEITTGLGPHAIAVDANAGHLYVGHFTDSYVGVYSLDQRFPRSYGKILATFGRPTPPRASK